LIAAYVTPPTSREVLVAFYRKVHPSGPGWRVIREGAGISEIEGARFSDRMGQAAIGWIAGCLTIWSSLFTIGNVLYGRYQLALVLFCVFLVSGIVLIGTINRLWDKAPDVR
jgi:solute:Na+ symporter, SSS family